MAVPHRAIRYGTRAVPGGLAASASRCHSEYRYWMFGSTIAGMFGSTIAQLSTGWRVRSRQRSRHRVCVAGSGAGTGCASQVAEQTQGVRSR
eukprot:1947518-Rhodomonas_salina.2